MTNSYSVNLRGRTILITGASSGIGSHLSRTFASGGAKVVLGARRRNNLDALCAEIKAGGGTALAVELDVADEASTIAAYDAAEVVFGPVDSVVANAGISVGGSALGISVEDFDRIVAINLRGAFLTAREGARRMIAANSVQRGHGRIVLMSSITAHAPPPAMVSYAASKAAVSQMARSMAKDWVGKGINVNAVAPGYIRTELNDALWDLDKGAAILAAFPRQRLMQIDALDPIVAYLCSDLSAPVTGSIFTIDDGQTL